MAIVPERFVSAMKGQYQIIVESPRLKYEFTIRRNITIIQGDSATGKTTLIDLINAYKRGTGTPIRIESSVNCAVFSGGESEWKSFISSLSDSIVFFDEGYSFIRSEEFAAAIRETGNYYVLITRESLPALPYSISEIYGIRTTGKYHFPEKIYHEFYPIYGEQASWDSPDVPVILTEDSRSGYLFFRNYLKDDRHCISAEGNGGIYRLLKSIPRDKSLAVIADGAAFGAFIEKVLQAARYRKNVFLYLPESFEWIILKSGILADPSIEKVLASPEDYIESRVYFSWEQFFTEYLKGLTSGDPVRQYQKTRLLPFYTEGKNRDQILSVFPEQIRTAVQEIAGSKQQP